MADDHVFVEDISVEVYDHNLNILLQSENRIMPHIYIAYLGKMPHILPHFWLASFPHIFQTNPAINRYP